MNNQRKEWILQQHRDTNHLYSGYLPYEFHLNMVVAVGKRFHKLLTNAPFSLLELALLGHDLIEDTRVSYNDVKGKLGEWVAEIIYAVSNEKGKNRKERANDKYYDGIRNTDGATFVKICDRIANVEYSKMVGSDMFDMYRKENDIFLNKVGSDKYPEMQEALYKLFDK